MPALIFFPVYIGLAIIHLAIALVMIVFGLFTARSKAKKMAAQGATIEEINAAGGLTLSAITQDPTFRYWFISKKDPA